MKKDIHPEYRDVVFRDVSCDYSFVTKSTVHTKDKVVWEDGKEYPLVKIDVSSQSHPFYTGNEKRLDLTGQIDKFNKKFAKSTYVNTKK